MHLKRTETSKRHDDEILHLIYVEVRKMSQIFLCLLLVFIEKKHQESELKKSIKQRLQFLQSSKLYCEVANGQNIFKVEVSYSFSMTE